MISISMDNGVTWLSCPDGVRINIEKQWIDGEESRGDLVFNFTHEGLITDIWVLNEAEVEVNVATSSIMYSELISQMIAESA